MGEHIVASRIIHTNETKDRFWRLKKNQKYLVIEQSESHAGKMYTFDYMEIGFDSLILIMIGKIEARARSRASRETLK
jgi:hypothetical protein